MTDRSEAANKAWATRRQNAADAALAAEAAKRSAAARKAWDTRRARSVADDRSSAAHKAWDTRRANGWVHPSKRA